MRDSGKVCERLLPLHCVCVWAGGGGTGNCSRSAHLEVRKKSLLWNEGRMQTGVHEDREERHLSLTVSDRRGADAL